MLARQGITKRKTCGLGNLLPCKTTKLTKSCKYVFNVNQDAIVFSFACEKKLKQRNVYKK